jgi:hypothetical protein
MKGRKDHEQEIPNIPRILPAFRICIVLGCHEEALWEEAEKLYCGTHLPGHDLIREID